MADGDGSISAKSMYYDESRPLKLGRYFEVDNIREYPLRPDRHLVIKTPGICYTVPDFKFDMSPVDGKVSDFGKIAIAGQEGVLCALVDCLRGRDVWLHRIKHFETLERSRDCQGKFLSR